MIKISLMISYASLMIKILVGEINNKQTEMLFLKKEQIQNLLRWDGPGGLL